MAKLNVKPIEFKTAAGALTCGSCGRAIGKGAPYLEVNSVNVENGEYVIDSKIECLRRCSTLRREPQPARTKVIRPEWDNLPDIAASEQRTNFPIVNQRDERVANGYSAIIPGFDEQTFFLECEDEQVVTKLFVIDRSNDDPWKKWVQMKTPSGFFGRRYNEPTGPFRADCWYFGLFLVRPALKKAA